MTTPTNKASTVRVAFFGTPGLVLPILDQLVDVGIRPVVVVTAPDRPVGRHQTITPPPVKIWARAEGIPVLQPENLDASFETELQKYAPDISVVVAYGKILPQTVIDIPKYGTFNIHYSLLPKYRGAAPVEAAILAGDHETGVSIQKMIFKLDAGPVVAEARRLIEDHVTGQDLRVTLTTIAAPLLIDTIPKIIAGGVEYVDQDESKATYAPKIKKEDGMINLKDDALINWRKYRAYLGWPGIFFFATRQGKQIRVLIKEAEYKDGHFIPKRVLPEGEREMEYESFLKS
jgi:methionyl-tRNA formyltransferase